MVKRRRREFRFRVLGRIQVCDEKKSVRGGPENMGCLKRKFVAKRSMIYEWRPSLKCGLCHPTTSERCEVIHEAIQTTQENLPRPYARRPIGAGAIECPNMQCASNLILTISQTRLVRRSLASNSTVIADCAQSVWQFSAQSTPVTIGDPAIWTI